MEGSANVVATARRAANATGGTAAPGAKRPSLVTQKRVFRGQKIAQQFQAARDHFGLRFEHFRSQVHLSSDNMVGLQPTGSVIFTIIYTLRLEILRIHHADRRASYLLITSHPTMLETLTHPN
jgi:hypothetical protein